MTSLLSPKTSYALCGFATLLAFLLPSPYPFLLLAAASLTLAVELPATRKRLKHAGLPIGFVVLLFMSSIPARAMFPVIDLGVIAQAVKEFVLLRQMYQNAVQIYATTLNSYNMAKQNMLAIGNKNTYRTWGVSLMQSNVPNRYGELNGWNAAMNNGIGIPAAYSNATLPLSPHTDFLSAEQLGSSQHLADLARVSVIDSTSQNSMATVAQITRQQGLNQRSLSQWESSVYSNSPNYNTEAAQQNLTNLGMVQMYEQGKANLAVNSILAQQMTVQNMKDRNEAVADLNRWQRVSEYNLTTPVWGNAEQGILNHQPY
ncbi:MAG: hypothetical protein M3Y72_00940 [Acidobacteriota bacterium]|nr:hypothetical protein [Acidobacteriota bacterium]